VIAQATGGEGAGVEKVLEVYGRIGWFSIGIGVVVLVVAPFIKKLMHLDALRDEDLAGRAQLAENEAPGMFPQAETVPATPRKG